MVVWLVMLLFCDYYSRLVVVSGVRMRVFSVSFLMVLRVVVLCISL